MGFFEELQKALEEGKKKAEEFKEEYDKAYEEAKKKTDEFMEEYDRTLKETEEKYHLKDIQQFCAIYGGVHAARDLIKKAEEGKLSDKEDEELRKYVEEIGGDYESLKRALDAMME